MALLAAGTWLAKGGIAEEARFEWTAHRPRWEI
jgi:hypothetical protein